MTVARIVNFSSYFAINQHNDFVKQPNRSSRIKKAFKTHFYGYNRTSIIPLSIILLSRLTLRPSKKVLIIVCLYTVQHVSVVDLIQQTNASTKWMVLDRCLSRRPDGVCTVDFYPVFVSLCFCLFFTDIVRCLRIDCFLLWEFFQSLCRTVLPDSELEIMGREAENLAENVKVIGQRLWKISPLQPTFSVTVKEKPPCLPCWSIAHFETFFRKW